MTDERAEFDVWYREFMETVRRPPDDYEIWQAAYAAATERAAKVPQKLWLWKNFVDGSPEYWAFDNPFPIHMDDGDPQTLGEPVGYALVKPSRCGRTDVAEAEVLRRIAAAAIRQR